MGNIWKIYARQSSDYWQNPEEYARECVQAGVIAVGWSEVGDLNHFGSWDQLCTRLDDLWGDEAAHGRRSISQWAGALWRFRTSVARNDYVICPDMASDRFHVGIVLSSRVFHDRTSLGGRCRFAHRRRVKWLTVLKRADIERIWPDGRFGGRQTVSMICSGHAALRRLLQRSSTRRQSGKRTQVAPDSEWGKEAESRAMVWLRGRGYKPVNVASLNLGWDIECDDLKFEVKGRKSPGTAIRLTQNEWAAARKHKRRYTLLVFTAADKSALAKADPVQVVDPSATEDWKVRVVYEYVLRE
jgi:hypothetical protein